jgi:Cu+-exporting ATPase
MQKTYDAIVEGMTCGNCALTISKLLEKKGMTNVSANAASGEVHFSAKEDEDIDQVYNAIDDMGYRVVRNKEGEAAHVHDHDHGHGETRLLIICAILTAPLLMHMFVSGGIFHNPWFQLALATPVYAIGCYTFLPSAWRSLKHRLPNMDVLIMLGASAAYFYSLGGFIAFPERYHEFMFFEAAASIITLVMTGNWLEHKTVRTTTKSIDALVKLQPQFARMVMKDSLGKETILEIESKYVRAGDMVLVNTGDVVPVDGTITTGEAQIDEKMITGESMPVQKGAGAGVVGGTLVQEGSIRVTATSVGSASVLSGIIRMVRDAQAAKSPMQKLADKISAIFVPAVLIVSVIALLVNYFMIQVGFGPAMMRSIAILVIACPCAMGLATPAAIAVGLGRAARNGMLIKGGDTLDRLKTIKQIVFDKTGTLTTGKLRIEAVSLKGMEESRFREVVASIENHSSHPIARSITARWKGDIVFDQIREVKGRGMEAKDNAGHVWQLGSESWLHKGPREEAGGHDLYLYENGEYRGSLTISDELRPDAEATIAELQSMGYKTILLTGDKQQKAEVLAAKLGIKEVHAGMSPEQKNQELERLMGIAPTAMVGDGINDAPALARATVGISLSESTQIAIQSAQIILSNNQLSSLPKVIRLGIYTNQTIKQNLFWAFIYNIVAIPVAAAGYLTPTWGAAIMAMSDVVLVANSLRLGLRKISYSR